MYSGTVCNLLTYLFSHSILICLKVKLLTYLRLKGMSITRSIKIIIIKINYHFIWILPTIFEVRCLFYIALCWAEDSSCYCSKKVNYSVLFIFNISEKRFDKWCLDWLLMRPDTCFSLRFFTNDKYSECCFPCSNVLLVESSNIAITLSAYQLGSYWSEWRSSHIPHVWILLWKSHN